MRGRIFSVEVTNRFLNEGKVCIEVDVKDVNTWIGFWSKRSDVEVLIKGP